MKISVLVLTNHIPWFVTAYIIYVRTFTCLRICKPDRMTSKEVVSLPTSCTDEHYILFENKEYVLEYLLSVDFNCDKISLTMLEWSVVSIFKPTDVTDTLARWSFVVNPTSRMKHWMFNNVLPRPPILLRHYVGTQCILPISLSTCYLYQRSI